MIVVDTSALLAILLQEPCSEALLDAVEREAEILISAGTLAEALIVTQSRNLEDGLAALLDALDVTVAPLTAAGARKVASAYARWGKGLHPAALNFGDCFAYALAEERGCPLLFVGADFTRTDVTPACSG